MVLRRLKELREDNDLRQIDIAIEIGIPERTYGNYEMGTRQIPLSVLTDLALFYNTSTDYILELTDTSKPYPISKK